MFAGREWLICVRDLEKVSCRVECPGMSAELTAFTGHEKR
jgi:hypothetical protein